MRNTADKQSLAQLFGHQSSLRAFSQVFRQKDYNKIGNKLRNYQHLALSLQVPSLSDVHQLQKIDTDLGIFNHVLTELQISTDQVVDDIQALNFRNYSEIVEGFMQIIQIMHEYMNRSVKESLHLSTIHGLGNEKPSINICQLCHEIQQANHLKKLKRQVGIDYLLEENHSEESKHLKTGDDQDYEQTSEFLDQLNALLAKKDKLLNISLNTVKLNALVDSLGKLTQFSDEMSKRSEQRKKTLIQNSLFSQQNIEENEQISQSHDKIVQQIREILNSKFKDGYSHRIRVMLEKFEAALKEDKTMKVQKKSYINVIEAECQTTSTPESVQIRLLAQELKEKQKQIDGIKEGRIQMEERFMKILDNQRKISKELNTSKHDEKGKLLEEIKKEREVRFEIEKNKDIFENQDISLCLISALNSEMPTNKSLLRSRRTLLGKRTEESKGKCLTSDKEIQTQNGSEEDKQTVNQLIQLPKQLLKRKKIQKYSKASLSSFLESPLISKSSSQNFSASDKDRRYLVSQVILFNFSSGKQYTSSAQQVHDFEDNKLLLSDINSAIIPSKSKPKNSKKKTQKIERERKQSSITKFSQKSKKKQKIPFLNQTHQPIVEEEKQVTEASIYQNGSNNGQDEILQSQTCTSQIYSKRNSALQRTSRFAVPNLKQSQFSKTSKTQFTYMSKIRLTQISHKKSYRINPPKLQGENTISEAQHYTTVRNKENKIRINKYERKGSSSMDKEKVREIVSLLKNQKRTETLKVRTSNAADRIEEDSYLKNAEIQQKDQVDMISQHELEKVIEVADQKQNIIQSILKAKAIIEAEYAYLHATGFITYLYSLSSKATKTDRMQAKYAFEFTHIKQTDVQLFGGIEDMLKYQSKKGKWRQILEEEVQLKINCKNYNFAAKICKYLSLLRKMNSIFHREYLSFLMAPVDYCLTNLSASQEFIYKLKGDNQNKESKENQGDSKENEQEIIQVVMRVINFHHKYHKNCPHVAQFLEKIGFYRYAL